MFRDLFKSYNPDRLNEVAARASVDSMIDNQRACSSSLVHYVETDEPTVLEYCEALRRALRRWDEHLPHALPRTTIGQLRMLRRGELLKGTWFENGKPPYVTSAVVYIREPFDVSIHPMCRFVVVRRVDDLGEALPFLNSGVSTVGVYPHEAIKSLRDSIATAGVSSIFPLGEYEQIYAGMPHDGMRTLSEFVNWTNTGP